MTEILIFIGELLLTGAVGLIAIAFVIIVLYIFDQP